MAISTRSPNTSNQKPKKLINLFSLNSIRTSMSSPSSSCLQTPTSSLSSSSSESMMEESIKTAYEIIHKWEINDHSYTRFISMFNDNNREAIYFINCVNILRRLMRFLASNNSKSEKLSAAQRLMQIAMKRLEREFHLILLNNNEQYFNPESVSSSHLSRSSIETEQHIAVSESEQLSMTAISNLRLIADTMISCGYGEECIVVYKNVRKLTINEGLVELGVRPYNSSSINKMLIAPHLENNVKTWLNAVQIAVKMLFRDEKFLCDHVFASYLTIRDSCFENSTKEGALNLFTFTELMATKCKRLKSETIFVLMDLHSSISDLWPEIESVFSHESVSSIKSQALFSLQKLGDSVRTILSKLESSIHKNTSKVTVPGGGIHPLNNSVMNYLSSVSNYGTVLSDVIIDDLHPSCTAVSMKVECIILVLLCKLDAKAKLHNHAALSYVFLVNNLNFIIEKVRTTNLKYILGDKWISNHENKLNQYVKSYELMSWNKVILCLPENLVLSKEKVRECFRRLYSTFNEVYGKQVTWIVVDENMRDRMKVSILNKLMPVYEEFYGKHLMTLSEDERCLKLLMRLSPENMAKYLSELFLETPAVLRSSWSSSLTLVGIKYVN